LGAVFGLKVQIFRLLLRVLSISFFGRNAKPAIRNGEMRLPFRTLVTPDEYYFPPRSMTELGESFGIEARAIPVCATICASLKVCNGCVMENCGL
jgi:hypothetical protein